MKDTINIEERKPIWIALSKLYLDTELQESDFRHIAFKIIESPYSLEKVKEIDKYEVFPVLQPNLLSVAGEWAGFNKDWLISSITDSLDKRNSLKKLGIESSYLTFKWMCIDYWKKLENSYYQIKSNPDFFIVTCQELWKKGIEPFEFPENEKELTEKLKTIAIAYKLQNRRSDFYQYLQEGHYWISLWTAYFLLEIFELKKSDKLIGLNDTEGIIDFCLDKVERNLPYLKTDKTKEKCKNWIENKKKRHTTKNIVQAAVSFSQKKN